VISNNLFLKNNIYSKNLKNVSIKSLSKKFDKIFLEISKDLKDSKKTLNVLNNKLKLNLNINKFKKYKKIAIIGMGGSILGSEAIYNFFKKKIKKKVYFFNDIDENKISDLKKKENLSKVLFIIISKSGNTIETLSNTFSLKILKKNSKNIIIISEKKNNLLFSISKKFNLFFVEHNNYIGGRYSVLSEVGMVPAYLMGLNISKIRSNIQNCLRLKNKFFLKESTTKIANLIKSKKFGSLIFLNYCPELEKLLFWCQQLIAESLGKKNKGLLPIISNAPKDHHSLLQLYLDGPKDKFFNIFSFKNNSKEKINIDKIKIKSFLNKKNLNTIKNAQKNSLIKAFEKKNIPFREFRIKNIKEEVIGEFFALFIVETIIIGKLLNINPFDQPAVEQVKIYTKKLLS
jgi:glucose-6-phosphate isomerase